MNVCSLFACLHIRIYRVHIYQRFYRGCECVSASDDDDDDQDDRCVHRCSDSIEISVLIELVNMRKTLRWYLTIIFD